MFRCNLAYEPVGFIFHRIIFVVSPIDRLRFDREHRERVKAEATRRSSIQATQPTDTDHYDPETALVDHEQQQQQTNAASDQPDWWVLARPLQLAGLIKRYHMVGNTFVVYFIAQNMILLHLTVKCFIHTLVTRDDPQMLAYFNSLYYPHLAGCLPEPHRFNQVLTCISGYCFSIRALRAYFLVRRSIVNATCYKEVHLGQVVLGYMSALNFTLKQWFRYFKMFIFYRTDPRDPSYLKLDHRVHSQFENMEEIDMMYYHNPMDFDGMFTEIWGPIDLENRTVERRRWHCTLPANRIDVNFFTLSIFLAWYANCSFVINFFLCSYWVILSALGARSFPPRNKSLASMSDYFLRWRAYLSTPTNSIRLVEMSALIWYLSLGIYDVAIVVAEAFALVQRVKKLKHLLEQDLDYVRQLSSSSGGVTMRSGSLVGYRHSIYGRSQSGRKKRRQAEALNSKINHHIKLAACMHVEFNDIKQSHLAYLNILVISSWICMSYAISLCFVMENTGELGLLITASFSCCNPLIFTLILCALLERSFRNLYRAMTRLLWNDVNLLTRKTVYHLIVTSSKFEHEESRSFSVFGLYAITPNSLAPFLAYMASAVCYLERFGLTRHHSQLLMPTQDALFSSSQSFNLSRSLGDQFFHGRE